MTIQTKNNSKKIFSSGKNIGILENNIFTKKVNRSKHFLRVLQAWGSDLSVLQELKRQGCKLVRLIESSGLIYEAPLQLIFERGIVKDLGYGPQLFLPEKEWEIKDPAQGGLFDGLG